MQALPAPKDPTLLLKVTVLFLSCEEPRVPQSLLKLTCLPQKVGELIPNFHLMNTITGKGKINTNIRPQ